MPLPGGSGGMGQDLSSILEEVRKYATQKIPGSLGQTAAQGRTLLGIGEIAGGIRKEAMGNEAALERQRIGEEGLNTRLGLTEAGANRRATIGANATVDVARIAGNAARTSAEQGAGLGGRRTPAPAPIAANAPAPAAPAPASAGPYGINTGLGMGMNQFSTNTPSPRGPEQLSGPTGNEELPEQLSGPGSTGYASLFED